jgi:hypothetical protein
LPNTSPAAGFWAVADEAGEERSANKDVSCVVVIIVAFSVFRLVFK